MLDPKHPAQRWRTFADFHRRGQVPPPDLSAWVVTCWERYEASALAGDPIGLDVAFGLGRPACHGWWTVEARENRNDQIRALRAGRFSDLDDGPAARAIAAAIFSPGNDPSAQAIVLSGCDDLSPKQIRRIIKGYGQVLNLRT